LICLLLLAVCPVSEAGLIQQHTAESVTILEDLLRTFIEIELPVQNKLLILRKFLQLKLARYASCVPLCMPMTPC
jgi:hypothetical protein